MTGTGNGQSGDIPADDPARQPIRETPASTAGRPARLSFLIRHWVYTLTLGILAIACIFAVVPRGTLYLADAHTEIVTLENIVGSGTSAPLVGAVFCFQRADMPTWAIPVAAESVKCSSGLVAATAPREANALEPEDGSRAVISRSDDGPLRLSLFAGVPKPDKKTATAGYLIGDGKSWTLPAYAFVMFDTHDAGAGRVISFRAAAELGDQPESQRLLFDGSVDVFRRGMLIDRFVSRSERLRTGDTVQFVDGEGNRAKVSGLASVAPGDQGAMRVTIQATGVPSAVYQWLSERFDYGKTERRKTLVYAAQISRIGTDPYSIRADDFGNLFLDPTFLYLSSIFGLVAFVGTFFLTLNDAYRKMAEGGRSYVAVSPKSETKSDSPTGPSVPIIALLVLFASTVVGGAEAQAEFRQVHVAGTPNIGQGFLVASGGLCYAIMPRHLLERPDGLIAGRAVVAPEGAAGRKVGARLHAEFPFDAVILETEGLPPGGCGPSIDSWRPNVREALSTSNATSLRSINSDGAVRTLSLVIRSSTFISIRVAPTDGAYIQQTMSGSLIVVGNEPVAMLLASKGDLSGSGMRIDQILASAREILGGVGVGKVKKPPRPPAGASLSLASAGASLLISSAAPVDAGTGAKELLASPEGKGLFRAVAPKGARLEINLAGETARPIGCIRLDFSGVPPKERPRSISFSLSALDKGAYFPAGTMAVSSVSDTSDRPFGLPQRARRLALGLQRSQHPEGILSIRRLIVLEAKGESGGCPG